MLQPDELMLDQEMSRLFNRREGWLFHGRCGFKLTEPKFVINNRDRGKQLARRML